MNPEIGLQDYTAYPLPDDETALSILRGGGKSETQLTSRRLERNVCKDLVFRQSRFQQAVAYARLASRANPLYARLAAGTTKNAYNPAIADWFSPTVIRWHQCHCFAYVSQ